MNDDEIITGNQTEEADLLKVLLALKANVMRDLQVAEIGRVTKIEDSNYYVTLLNNSEQKIVCKTFGVSPLENDLVLVIFTNTEYQNNLSKAQNDIQTQTITTKEYHSYDFGLIISNGKASGTGGSSVYLRRWSD